MATTRDLPQLRAAGPSPASRAEASYLGTASAFLLSRSGGLLFFRCDGLSLVMRRDALLLSEDARIEVKLIR